MAEDNQIIDLKKQLKRKKQAIPEDYTDYDVVRRAFKDLQHNQTILLEAIKFNDEQIQENKKQIEQLKNELNNR